MGLNLKHHHVVNNTEHPEHLLLQLTLPQNLLSKRLWIKTKKFFLNVVISQKTLPILRFVLTLDSSMYSLTPKCSSFFLWQPSNYRYFLCTHSSTVVYSFKLFHNEYADRVLCPYLKKTWNYYDEVLNAYDSCSNTCSGYSIFTTTRCISS